MKAKRHRTSGEAIAVVLLCLGLTAAGCGGSDNQSSTDRQASTDLTTGVNVARREVEGVAKPANPVPKGPPPKKLAVRDLIVGKGPPAKVGDTIKLEYIGIGWNGRPFSDSWTYPEVPVFQLGDERLEHGLDLGIRGMRAGGRREVAMPADLLYWPDQPHERINPENAVLFVVDLFEIR